MDEEQKLTDKQTKFAILVGIEGKTKSEAYRIAYGRPGASIERAANEGTAISRKPHVAKVIAHYREQRRAASLDRVTMGIEDLMRVYVAIALTDPNELVQLRVGCCRYCWGIEGKYQWREREYLTAVREWEAKNEARRGPMPSIEGGLGFAAAAEPNPRCDDCGGEGVSRVVPLDTTRLSEGARHLYRGCQLTKEGIKIKFADKDKTLENIGRILGAFDDRVRLNLDNQLAELRKMPADPAEAGRAYQQMLADGRLQ